MFEFGRNHHNHAAPVDGMVAVKIKSLIKQEAKQDVFWPASEVVNNVLLSELTDAPYPCLPRVDSLQRTANRTRQQLRPQDLKDLDFDLQMEHIPDGFFREDVKVSIWPLVRDRGEPKLKNDKCPILPVIFYIKNVLCWYH